MNAQRAASSSSAVLEVRDLAVEFPGHGAAFRPVRGVSLSLERGQRLGLVGESGSGKSLTALALMRLLPRQARIAQGSVMLDDRDLVALSEREMTRMRGGRIAMVYQDPMSSLNPVQTIGHQIAEAIRAHERVGRNEARGRTIELLRDVGVTHAERRFDSYPHEFSGGMRQRAMIAMAVCGNPDVLIADEPTTALDMTTQARIIDLLDSLVAERGMAVLLITHDLGVAGSFCDAIQVMYAGRIVEAGEALDVFGHPVHPYTEGLVASICELDRDVDKPIVTIAGQPPLPQRLPHGCPFHPRCPAAESVCSESEPALLQLRGGRRAACHFADARLDRTA
ncbi:MAG TPA: ABC transporter ATP-binding protein [Gaiellaceae bacterium]